MRRSFRSRLRPVADVAVSFLVVWFLFVVPGTNEAERPAPLTVLGEIAPLLVVAARTTRGAPGRS